MAIKRNKKYNNVYSGGGLLGKLGSLNESLTDKFLGEKTLGNLGKLGITKNNIGGITNTAATMLGGVLAGQNQSGVGNAMQSIGSLASNIPGVGGIIGAGVNLLGGITNAAFGSHLNQENINKIEGQVNNLNSFQSVASDYDALSSEYSNAPTMGYFSKDSIGSDGWFSNKAKNKWRNLLDEKSKAEDWVQRSLANNALNIANNTLASMEANYTAYGGPLTMRYSGLMSPFGNQFESGGGIHIKKKNRGKFTSYCGGKVTNECIQRGLHSSNPTTRKRANFARNARKWHSFGGWLNSQGGDFSNGVIQINSGGLHSTNPFGGVQMGIDPQGVPNLVEEGEVIYNDYVFSNRLKVPKAIRQKYKLRDNITFADAAKKLGKESEERPNDPISQRGLEAFMSALAESQEEVRIKEQARENNKMALGGLLSAAFGSNADNYRTAKGNLEFGMYDSSNPYDNGGPLNYTVDDLLGSGVIGNPFAPNLEKAALNNKVSSSALNEAKRLSYPKNTSLSYLRYAPILGSAFATVSDIFSSPDYSAADRVSSVNIRPTYIKATPVSQRLKYSPFDRLFYINQLNKSTAANRSAVKNISGGNRATALAGILASDMNYGDNLGKLARQAEEYNQALDERVNTFNRATDMFNVQQSLQAQSANAQALSDATKMKLAQAEEVAKLRQAARNAYDARRSTNLNNFINNLGNLGWEEQQGDWLDNLARRGVLMMDTSGRYTGHSKGGKLNKRRRTTYA